EVDISVEDGKVSVRLLDAGSPVKLIWEELRILANSFIGEFCERHAVPAFYRVEPSIPENLLAEDDYDPIAVRNQKRIMPRARLQADPEPHHGLGVEHYVPIDSALHRYTDLLMHQQLVNLLVTDEPRYSPDDLRQAFLQTAWCRETRRDIETKSRRYWLLKYLEGFTGQDLEGVVLERLRHGCLVQLSNCLLWSFAPASPDERLSPGDRIRVAVNGVSARRNTIQLANPQRVQG
ncbi:MAG: RNB domain-containing ribonuclease, partial [Planctomycetota bacterium]|nr:RNB domain-containing ribonuclease [Planctomycetota bacterium]